jgi:YjbE family integral membrane protein
MDWLNADWLNAEWIAPFIQVVLIDLTLAGDNAIVIGLAAAGLPQKQRGKAILIGIIAATVMRIAFSIVTTQLLQIVGLLLAGGILLLWVSWKMWRELRKPGHVAAGTDALKSSHTGAPAERSDSKPEKTLGQAVMQIVIADFSMSLDNVLAVAGAAREHPTVLVFGLALSILLMGIAATAIARLLQKHRWIAYIGLAIILFVSLEMIYRGGEEVLHNETVKTWIEDKIEAVKP